MVVDEEEEDTETASEFEMTTNQMVYLGLGVIIVILLGVLIFGGKRPPKAQQSAFTDHRYQPMNNQYSSVPSAPVLPPANDMFQ